jgi:hypothetical protein
MSLTSGLISGLSSGLQVGLNPEPAASVFPVTAASFAVLAGDPAVVPTLIVPCQEGSGNLVDTVGGEEFAPSGSPLYAQTITGLVSPRVAIGSATGAHFETANTSLMDASASVSHLVVFSSDGTSSGELISKRGSDGIIFRSLSTGQMYNYIDSSTTADYRANNNDSHTSGDAIAAWLVVNRTTMTVTLFTSVGTTTQSMAGYGTLTTTAVLRILDSLGTTSGLRVCYYAGFEGAAAEAVDQTVFDNFAAAVIA